MCDSLPKREVMRLSIICAKLTFGSIEKNRGGFHAV